MGNHGSTKGLGKLITLLECYLDCDLFLNKNNVAGINLCIHLKYVQLTLTLFLNTLI